MVGLDQARLGDGGCQAAGRRTVTTLLTGSYPGRPPKEIIQYDGNDHATSIDDGTNTTRETLAPSGRVLHRVVTDGMLGSVSDDTIFGYSGPGDSPAYTRSGLLGLTVMTYVSGPGGLLAIDKAGAASYPISNGHGDVVGTTDANGTFMANPPIDEFGLGTPPAGSLGYLGDKERFSTGGTLNLIRMGVRLYDPVLGRFLARDPIPGGSANDYDYSSGDPINSRDPSGTDVCRGRSSRYVVQNFFPSEPYGTSVVQLRCGNRGQGFRHIVRGGHFGGDVNDFVIDYLIRQTLQSAHEYSYEPNKRHPDLSYDIYRRSFVYFDWSGWFPITVRVTVAHASGNIISAFIENKWADSCVYGDNGSICF
jgi:RHS repeat-associated protein